MKFFPSIENLKTQLDDKQKELDEEKERVEELTQMYIRENKDSETEFKELKQSNDKLRDNLKQEKSQRQILSNSNLEMRTQIGESYKRFDCKRALVKYQSQSEVIKVIL